jgi:hypothetical protein
LNYYDTNLKFGLFEVVPNTYNGNKKSIISSNYEKKYIWLFCRFYINWSFKDHNKCEYTSIKNGKPAYSAFIDQILLCNSICYRPFGNYFPTTPSTK